MEDSREEYFYPPIIKNILLMLLVLFFTAFGAVIAWEAFHMGV